MANTTATFPYFFDLAPELRRIIWIYAFDSHNTDALANLPPVVYRATTWNGRPLPLDDGKTPLIIDCRTLSAVCREARDIYLAHIPQGRSFKYIPPAMRVERIAWKELPVCLNASDKTLTIKQGQFHSAQHLVATVNRLKLGLYAEHLVLEFHVNAGCQLALHPKAYWRVSSFWNTNQEEVLVSDFYDIFAKYGPITIDPQLSKPTELTGNSGLVVSVSSDRRIRASKYVWDYGEELALHVLRVRDLFDAAEAQDGLRRLRQVDVDMELVLPNLEVYMPDEQFEWLRLTFVKNKGQGEDVIGWVRQWPSFHHRPT